MLAKTLQDSLVSITAGLVKEFSMFKGDIRIIAGTVLKHTTET